MSNGPRSRKVLVDLLLTLRASIGGPTSDAERHATQAAILHRICQTIERRLDDPELAPARVAQAEGISERYLQKLFEASATISPIMSASAGCSAPGPICPIRPRRISRSPKSPTRYGFGDSAHFSRAFRHRFGLPPREFRQQEAERATPPSRHHRATRLAAGRAGAVARASGVRQARSKIAALTDLDEPMNAPGSRQAHHHLAGRGRAGPLGLFQPLAVAAGRDQSRAIPSPSRR